MKGEITFDTIISEVGQDHIEGCYRLDGEEWKVFHLTHRAEGKWWAASPVVKQDAIWKSGIKGVDATYPKDVVLNKLNAMELLSDALGGVQWTEVRGPDSLRLK